MEGWRITCPIWLTELKDFMLYTRLFRTDPGDARLMQIKDVAGRLRRLISNSCHREAHDDLFGMRNMASEVAYLNGDKFWPALARPLWNCNDLRCYLATDTSLR